MNIERVISWFDKNTDQLLGERNINNISLETLKDIFKPGIHDSLMYNPYTIFVREAEELKKYIDMDFDLNKFFYQLDCFQV